jgi:uncharacterized membrane protein
MHFDLSPIATSSLAIKVHLATVLPAFAIGTYQIFASKKGSPAHRALGYVYLILMSITAIAAIFIHSINPTGFLGFSPVHLFVPLTAWSVYNAIVGARTHNIRRHRGAMIGLYIGGLLIAGALTFLPGRVMHQVFFPATETTAPAR